MDVSHPDSTNYGNHLSADDVHDIFAPSEETTQAVKAWSVSSGVEEEDIMHYTNRGWLAVDLPVTQVESMLGVEYYEHEDSQGRTRVGCDEYHLPAHLSEHVDFIKPGIVLSAPLRKRVLKRDGEQSGPPRGGPGWGWGPPHYPSHPWPHWNLLLALADYHLMFRIVVSISLLYDIPNAKYSDPANKLGIFEYGDVFAQGDIDKFFAKFAPQIPQGTAPQVDSIDGGEAPVAVNSLYNTGESDVGLSLGYALIYPQQIIVYQTDDIPTTTGERNNGGYAGFLNDFIDAIDGSYCNYTAYGITGNSPGTDPSWPDPEQGGYKGQLMCGTYSLTRGLSASYGEPEIDLPKPYVERHCNEFMELGLQGHSVLFSSSDFCVGGSPDPNRNNCISSTTMNNSIYNPDYPSGCPYITSVGGTRLYPNDTINDPESAMSVNLTAFNIATGEGTPTETDAYFGSGGGFSNYFSPPAYQQAAVAKYLAEHNDQKSYIVNSDASNIGENNGVYKRAGRGYPDVSANGAFLQIFNNATQITIFGTSLSAPIFGSVLTLLNEELTRAGKPPVGFVNPALYAHPYVLNDITNGSNANCGGPGFETAVGWDPVTGLGTPDYPRMLELFMGLK
ncbi:hypothetical protein LTR78_002153 [Recurvomyces mirabilis]|uniref:Peptidase S53 domain-containing protein n=1 Tax=Recurvomyces mirabilis TaxID=574656 RepID=A0AAE0WUJ1_9PEZI|nr:hypothetical protein LTR78_002153 [Recurvomyces mirabilis]KAK5160610.1 hypothetical protein LTS14_001622 [Recurvomyces mirabilis]